MQSLPTQQHQNQPFPNQGFPQQNPSPYTTAQYPTLPPTNQQASHQVGYQAVPTYFPPNQYPGPERPVQSIDPRTALIQKVKSAEKKLESGWIVAYSVWIIFLMIAALGGAVFLVLINVHKTMWAGPIVGNLWGFFTIGWLFRFCWIQFRAIRQKSLKDAKKAYKTFQLFAVNYLLLLICFPFVTKFYMYSTDTFVMGFIIPIFINFKGTRRVAKLLKKINKGKEELLFKYNIAEP